MNQHTGSEGHILPLVSLKGGVGKTTIAINLAVGLAYAHRDSRVVLVDANPVTGDVGVMLNMRSTHNLLDAARLSIDPMEVDFVSLKQTLVHHESGLHVLLAPQIAHMEDPGTHLGAEGIHQLLWALRQHFDYIIVDTPARIDDIVAGSVGVASGLLLISTPTIPALKDTKVLLNEFVDSNIPAERTMIIMNQTNRPQAVKRDQVERFTGYQVYAQIPFDDGIDRAVNRATTLITMSSGKYPSAKALRDLVQLIGKDYPSPAEAQSVEESQQQLGTRYFTPPYVHPQRNHIGVIVADDQEETRELIREMLRIGSNDLQLPLQIIEMAENGTQAIEQAADHIPDVILMDINMPGVDGLEAARRIVNEHPSVAIIVVSVHQDAEYFRKAIKMGVADFIPKALLSPKLAKAVEEVYFRYQPIRARYRR